MVYEWDETPEGDFAVIGNPVEHSLSPQMHQAAYEALGMEFSYVAVRVDPGRVAPALEALAMLGYKGVNVTVPHKREVLSWAEKVEPFAAEVEAANTVDLVTRTCTNTDAPGFLLTLKDLPLTRKSALVLGAGGSARALVAALAADGWEIKLYNRTAGRASELALKYGCLAVETADPTGASLILNTTSSAFDGEAPPVEWEKAEPDAVAYDLMYAKSLTPFLARASENHLVLRDGLELLVAQGALSFEWWTGLKPPREAMRAAIS